MNMLIGALDNTHKQVKHDDLYIYVNIQFY